MDIVIHRDELVQQLAIVDSVVSRKPTIPIYSSMKLEANGHGLQFAATDTELIVRGSCQGTIQKQGEMLVPARKLLELARTFVDAPVHLISDAKGVAIEAGGFKGRLPTFPTEDYPRLATIEAASMIELPVAGLRELIARTRFVMSAEDKRYFLLGVLLETDARKLRLVASDGHRMALAETSRDNDATTEPVIVPKKTVEALATLLADADEVVYFAHTEQHLFFTIGDNQLVSRKIDGQFPAYRNVIPKHFKTSIDVDRAAMLEVLKRGLVIAESSSRRAKLTIEPNRIRIGVQSQDYGEGEESVAVDYRGDGLQFQVNGDYVREFLEVAGTDKIELKLNEANLPVGLESIGGDVTYRYIVMPQVG